MRAQRYLPNYTVEDYLRWEGDWELIDGVPSAMSPAPSKQHQFLGVELTVQITNALRGLKGSCGNCRVVYETDWVIDNFTVLRPDVTILCDDEKGTTITKAPAVIIEIVSPSSSMKDRNTKLGIYEEQRVPYYMIIDPIRKHYTVFTLEEDKYTEQGADATFNLHGGCTITLDMEEAFSNLPK